MKRATKDRTHLGMLSALIPGLVFGATLALFVYADPVETAPGLEWCQTLGIRCEDIRGGELGRTSVPELLSQAQPSQFLPEALISYLVACGPNGICPPDLENPLVSGGVGSTRPRRIHAIEFIPVARAREGLFSGHRARIVADCQGRRLQILADTNRPEDFLELLKGSLEEILQAEMLPSATRITTTRSARPSGHVTANVCPIRVGRGIRCLPTAELIYQNLEYPTVTGPLSERFFAQACVDQALDVLRSAPAPQQPGRAVVPGSRSTPPVSMPTPRSTRTSVPRGLPDHLRYQTTPTGIIDRQGI